MSNRIIELHDSTVAVIFYFDGSVVIIFSHAYVHESEGEPGVDPGSGWCQRAELVIGNAPEPDFHLTWPFEIYEGSLFLDEVELDNTIPIPLEHVGSVKLKLVGNDYDDAHSVIEIEGQKAQLTMLGEAYYVEEFPG